MLEKLNNINFNNISNNPNLGIEVGREIQNASWIKSPFFSITGTGADRGVRLFSVASQQPFRPRIKAQLTGSGVSGNTDFEANYDNLEILSQTIYPDAFGNSLRSKIKAYSELERIDFIKESVDSLTTWMNEERDKRIVASLTNDFTNYLYNNKMNVATIRKAIFHARNGLKGDDNTKAFPIKPIKEKTTPGKLDLLEARVYATMLASEEFRYIARRYLTPSDVTYPIFFKRLVSGDFRGLDFLKKFKIIPESYQKSALVELKTKGLKHSLTLALERKDYALAEALNAKIKEIQAQR
ncbi:hypothetical protein ACR9KD_07990 [Helicobacter pylori]